MAATAVVLLIGIVLVASVALASWACLDGLHRRRHRRMWDDLVARHQDLDRELNRIWRQ